jgi:hypothetical protein
MYQSSPRKNFLDFLIEPTSIAILCSIALHAILGASLPFFTQLEKEITKADPGTVKVVELTPNELQRIPQAPPVPVPEVATPVPSPQVVIPPISPPISPNSPTIPFSPIRIPLEKLKPQPAKGKKDRQGIPQKQPTAPLFDRNISFNPTPKPTKLPARKGVTTRPTPIPTPAPLPIKKKPKVLTTVPLPNEVPSPTKATDDDGGNLQPTNPATFPRSQSQNPGNTSPTGTATGTATNSTRPATGASGNSPGGTPGSDGNSFPQFYGKYVAEATERVQQYLKAYPGIQLYTPATLQQSYPVGAPCTKVKQTPFIVLMVAFDKVPENNDSNPLGESTAPSIDKPYVAADKDTPENRKLGELAVNTALYAANKADQNRPPADKGKKVLYQYRVQFDPTTCKR